MKKVLMTIAMASLLLGNAQADPRHADGSAVHPVVQSATNAAMSLEREAQQNTPSIYHRQQADRAWDNANRYAESVDTVNFVTNTYGVDFRPTGGGGYHRHTGSGGTVSK